MFGYAHELSCVGFCCCLFVCCWFFVHVWVGWFFVFLVVVCFGVFFKNCRRMGKKSAKTWKYGQQTKQLPWQNQMCEEGRERKVIWVSFLWTVLITCITIMLQTKKNEPDLTQILQRNCSLPQTTSMTQHSGRIILQMKILTSKCKEVLKAPKSKRGQRGKAV